MGSTMNGVVLHGNTRIYGGTFLIFSDYMRPAVRLAALMKLPVTYVWTHDSIGLGEDGPTHQPVEHLAALRAIPGLTWSARPTPTRPPWSGGPSWSGTRPAAHGLALTRQNLPDRRPHRQYASRGALPPPRARPGAATCWPRRPAASRGSSSSAPARRCSSPSARDALEADGVPTRVVSLPCLEWFREQDQAYREQVLPPAVRARVSVEAAVGQGWREIVGDAGRICLLEHFGARPRTRCSTSSSDSPRTAWWPPPIRAPRRSAPLQVSPPAK